jgi:O-antigen/teichoic acid export membrane protein
VLRNGALNLAGQGIYAVFYLVAVSTLARGLGREAFGTYYMLFALVLVVQLLCEAGLGTVLTRRLARTPDLRRQTMAEAAGLFAVSALASVGSFAVLGAAWCCVQGEAALWPRFAAAGLACAAMQGQRFGAAVFAGFELFVYENFARVLQGAIFAGLAALLVVLGVASPATVMAALAASCIIATLFLLACLWHRFGVVLPRWASLWNWLSESVPLGLGDVLRGLVFQVDTLLLGLLQVAAVVGVYSVAYRPLGPINWVPLAILTAVFPSLARPASNPAELSRTFAASVRLLWIAGLPIAVFFCVCAEPIVVLIAGGDYIEAARPLRVVIWITCLMFLSYPFRFLFTALGRPQVYAGLVLLGLTVQVGAELILIPRFGYWGACAGSVLGETLFTIAGIAMCRRLGVGGIEWPALGGAALAAVGMACVLWPARRLPLPLLVPAAAGAAALYLVLCVALGALRRSEVRRFREACGVA